MNKEVKIKGFESILLLMSELKNQISFITIIEYLIIPNKQSSKHQLKFFQFFEPSIEEEKLLACLEENADQEIETRHTELAQKPIKFEKRQLFETINRLHEEGLKWKTIASSFGKTDRALRYFRKRINQPLQKVGRKLAIDNKTLDFLTDLLQSKNTATTLKEMADCLNDEFGERFSEPTIFRALKRKGITWKKTTPHYLEQIPLLEQVSKYTDKVKLLPQSLIIAVDECGFNLETVPRYNWSFKGSRSFIFKPGIRSVNYTLILCIRNVKEKGVIHWELIEGGAKAQDFHRFITNLKFLTNEKYYLMLDNASIHRAVKACRDLGLSTIKELIASKNIEPIYLVAYSPQLNPVELIFNIIRHSIEKSRPRTFEELKLAVEKEIEWLNKEDLTKYFQSCLNYFD